MAGIKVQALYDFVGDPGTAELSITTGEILTLTRQDVGEGWWEGINSQGQTGLFPAAYVEEIRNSLPPPAGPPPKLPDTVSIPNYNQQSVGEQETWESQKTQNFDPGDFWDDEWDDDSESGGVQGGFHPATSEYSADTIIARSDGVGDMSSGIKFEGGKGTVGRRSFNRFTTFVKSGGESYILGILKVNVPDVDKVYIYETDGFIIWNPITQPYSCLVSSPKKESKLKGIKTFIAYQLTPSFNNIQVSRRYKHFDWLHERLEEKFSLIPIPPLPDKQISGRYEENFIEHRRLQLQEFVDSVCRHPVLSRCDVWQHFLTCTDEKRWKAGKRKAEKDDLVGANFFATLQAPERSLDVTLLEQDVEKFSKFVHFMDGAVKNLMATAADQTKKHQSHYKREYQKIGQAFHLLGQSSEVDKFQESHSLAVAMKKTGEIYNEIGRLFEEQPKFDWEPFGDKLHIYKGILSSFPDILTLHKAAHQKRKECDKLTSDHKMETTQLMEVNRRTDVVSYALLAEINHFHSERIVDFKQIMKNFLGQQMMFYQKIVGQLQEALDAYDN